MRVMNAAWTAPGPSPGREQRSDAARNRQSLLRAATTAIHREGHRVPMAVIAAEAGVGIGTLYRHFPTREDLLEHLTRRSFEQVLANAKDAEREGSTAVDALRIFVEFAIAQRNDLVLPLHGGPPVGTAETEAVRDQVHEILRRIIDRGQVDHTLRAEITPQDIVVLGSMLAQPRPGNPTRAAGVQDPAWDIACRRLLAVYLAGAGVSPI
jgi:AcrR family transcriptional regulator